MGILGAIVSSMLGGVEVIPYNATAKVNAEIQAYHPNGAPYAPRNGIMGLVLQKNPETFGLPEKIADYIETKAWGRQNATLQYTGGLQQEYDFTFPLIDHYTTGGPPHARIGSDGSVITSDFENLLDVRDWLEALREPIAGLRQPPFVRIVWGPNIEEGVLRSITPKILHMYPDGYPMVMEVTLRIKPEPILVYTDTSKLDFSTGATSK